MQFDRMIGGTRVVNAGSIGMPFGEPRADWLLLGPGVELRQTSYDLARAAEEVRATDYPQASEFAASILQPPSAAAMVDLFTSASF
jgi:hypothetical protein